MLMGFIDLTIKNLVRKMNVNKKKYKVISIFQKNVNQMLPFNSLPPTITFIIRGLVAPNVSTNPTKLGMFESQPLPVE